MQHKNVQKINKAVWGLFLSHPASYRVSQTMISAFLRIPLLFPCPFPAKQPLTFIYRV